MTFQEAEKTYKDIRSQHASGKLSDTDFENQVNQLKVQDAQGRWWQLGVRTGEWYVNDGQKWVKSKPPTASQPPMMPTSSPEDQEPPQVEKAERPSVLPRGIFSPKPEQHNGGGMPRPLLIGIIAAVAVIVLAVIVGAFFLLGGSSLFGGTTARATSTPTQAVAILPTLAPTATPAATDTPAPTETLVITATNTVAPTAAVRATATRRPNTPTPTKTVAGPSATPQVAPGLYVTKMALDTGAPEPNVKFGFRVSFFNNTGASVHKDKWQVVIYQVNNQDKSFGDTAIKTLDIAPGNSEVTLTQAWQVGPSGPPDCNYVAAAYYYDENTVRQPFPNTNGQQFRLRFDVCK